MFSSTLQGSQPSLLCIQPHPKPENNCTCMYMQFLREIRTFSGKKAFFSCNFQLQSEARRRLLVRSCLGAPPATAHGGHWDVAATGDGLSVTQISWQFRGQLVGNSGHWATEPWSPWSTWWTFGQRGAGVNMMALNFMKQCQQCYFEPWNCEVTKPRWWRSQKKCALTGLVLHWHFHLAPNDDQPSPCWIFLAPSEATPTQFPPFEWQNASYWSDWLIVSGEYRAPLMFHSVWVCLPLNVQHYLLAGNRTHEPCRVAQIEQGPHEQLMKLFWVSGALARQSVITLECCTYIHTHTYIYKYSLR